MSEQIKLDWCDYQDLTEDPVASALLVLADAVGGLALQVRNLGNADAGTRMGGMEALGKVLSEAIDGLGGSISDAAAELGENLSA